MERFTTVHFYPFLQARSLSLLACVATFIGCVIEQDPTQDADEAASNMQTPADDGTDGAEGASTAGQTSETPSDDPTTDPHDSDAAAGGTGIIPDGICDEFCRDGCLFEESRADCLEDCEYMLAQDWGPVCNEGVVDWIQCMIDNACVEADCWEEDVILAEQCECGVGVSWIPDGSGECSIETDCGDEEVEMKCLDGVCECAVAGEVVAICDVSPSVCSVDDGYEDLYMALESCCGVVLPGPAY